jgi:hypothetical protein
MIWSYFVFIYTLIAGGERDLLKDDCVYLSSIPVIFFKTKKYIETLDNTSIKLPSH